AQYRAVFTNSAGSATSAAAKLTVCGRHPVPPVVTVAPTVTRQPASVTARLGSTVSFTAKANGRPAPAVTWQRELAGGGWATVAGARSDTLRVAVSAALDGAKYRAVFTNVAGSVTSSAATLTVKKVAPKIVKQPKSVTVASGHAASFTVEAEAYPAPAYHW
ncbi:immunoglobulin domain-containing protein, partial [Paenibacillus sp. TAF58]